MSGASPRKKSRLSALSASSSQAADVGRLAAGGVVDAPLDARRLPARRRGRRPPRDGAWRRTPRCPRHQGRSRPTPPGPVGMSTYARRCRRKPGGCSSCTRTRAARSTSGRRWRGARRPGSGSRRDRPDPRARRGGAGPRGCRAPASRATNTPSAMGAPRLAARVRKLEIASTGFAGHRTRPVRASSRTSSHVDGGTGQEVGPVDGDLGCGVDREAVLVAGVRVRPV